MSLVCMSACLPFCTVDYKPIDQFAETSSSIMPLDSGIPREGLGCSNPPEFPKALQNLAKLNLICENLKIAEFRTPTLQDVRKKGSKILKLPRFTIILH